MKRVVGDIEKRLIKIAKKRGLEVEYLKSAAFRVAAQPPLAYQDSEQLAHEIGHWVCAPSYRRYEKFFGLTGAFGPKRRILNEDFCEQEDVRAHIVGAAFLLQAKAPESVVCHYLTDGDLPDKIDRRCCNILRRLQVRGLISEKAANDIERIWA